MNKYKFGIICAMHEEAEKIISEFSLRKVNSFPFEEFENDSMILIKSSIGKVASSAATTRIIEKYNPTYIVNIGLAGAINKNLKVPDAFLVGSIFQHDVMIDIEPYKTDLYMNLNCRKINFYNGDYLTLATGDQFIEDGAQIKADIVDMEGFSVAYICNKYTLEPPILIKGISDYTDNDSSEDIFINLEKAMNRSIQLLKSIIKNI